MHSEAGNRVTRPLRLTAVHCSPGTSAARSITQHLCVMESSSGKCDRSMYTIYSEAAVISWKCQNAEIKNSSNKKIKKFANLLAPPSSPTTIKLNTIVQGTQLKALDVNQNQRSSKAFIQEKLLNSRQQEWSLRS